MKSLIITSCLISILAGLTIESGILGTLEVDDILANALNSANSANIHQFATALELYYSDHNHYPLAQSGEKTISLLYNENYIKSLPLDKSVFDYQSLKNGQDYELRLKD